MGRSIGAIQAAANLNEWAMKVAECRQSGLCATEWCREKGIKPNLYFKWQRKVFDALIERQERGDQEVPGEEGGGTEEVQFAEFPIWTKGEQASEQPLAARMGAGRAAVSATLRMKGAEIDIYSGADVRVVEVVCREVRPC